MRIPLPKLMRHWRAREFERKLTPKGARQGLGAWAWAAKRPGVYRAAAALAQRALRLMGRGSIRSLPGPGGAWTLTRDFPAPEAGGTFMSRWNPDAEGRRGGRS